MSVQDSANQVEVIRNSPSLALGGAILDENGKEILITEAMVQEACQACDKQWITPEKTA